jgi:hypothetical protein
MPARNTSKQTEIPKRPMDIPNRCNDRCNGVNRCTADVGLADAKAGLRQQKIREQHDGFFDSAADTPPWLILPASFNKRAISPIRVRIPVVTTTAIHKGNVEYQAATTKNTMITYLWHCQL